MEIGDALYPKIGRKLPAQGAHIYPGKSNIFFVTVGAKDRTPWIGQPQVQAALTKVWRDNATAWRVGYYLLMPDHLHCFCAPYEPDFGIDNWITFWKREFTKMNPGLAGVWQRGAFHHRMRDRFEYEEKLSYVQSNPLRKDLVAQAGDWKLQGRIHDISWIND